MGYVAICPCAVNYYIPRNFARLKFQPRPKHTSTISRYGMQQVLRSPFTPSGVLQSWWHPPGKVLHIWKDSWRRLSAPERWWFFPRHFSQRVLSLLWHAAQHCICTFVTVYLCTYENHSKHRVRKLYAGTVGKHALLNFAAVLMWTVHSFEATH